MVTLFKLITNVVAQVDITMTLFQFLLLSRTTRQQLSGVSMCTFAFAFAFAFAYAFAFAFAFAFSLSPCLRFACVLLCVIQNGSDHMIYKDKLREK